MKGSGKHNRESDHERLLYIFGKSHSEAHIDRLHRILRAIRDNRGITVEEIAAKTRLEYRQTAEATALLEIEGIISIDLLQRCSINYKNV